MIPAFHGLQPGSLQRLGSHPLVVGTDWMADMEQPPQNNHSALRWISVKTPVVAVTSNPRVVLLQRRVEDDQEIEVEGQALRLAEGKVVRNEYWIDSRNIPPLLPWRPLKGLPLTEGSLGRSC